MDEGELQASIDLYKTQLAQVESALNVTPDGPARDDLLKLQSDLEQLLELTQDSLLSLKKSQLLGALDGAAPSCEHDGNTANTAQAHDSTLSDMDREFLAFQAAIGDSSGPTESEGPSATTSSTQHSAEDSDDSTSEEELDLQEIAGTKCRVPYRQDWGPISWENAMVVCAEPLSEEEEPAVRVLFCNPSESSMLPCPYFLDGNCKFDSDQCRYCHGYRVKISDLHEFQEPNYSILKLSSRCKAKYYADNLWYDGKVVDVLEEHHYKVMFDDYGNTETVAMEDILPVDGEGDDDSDEDGEEGPEADLSIARSDNEDEDDEIPVFLWRPAKTTDAMGEWEKHTKGIGSRLMQKMGYIIGQGLGKNGEGRAEPVPIQLLPSGKSLDKIMELKERAGDQDLYDVMKKRKHRQKKINDKAAASYIKPKPQSVFDVINKKLGGKKGDLHALTKSVTGKKTERHHIQEADLKSRSDKHLNVQLFKTHEEVKNVDRQLKSLKETLSRNNGRDKGLAAKIQQKISSMQAYRQQLTSSADSIEKHKTTRKDHKKMAIF